MTLMENWLRCWVRELGVPKPSGDTLELDLTSSGVRLEAAIAHWSPTGRHRFSDVRLAGRPADLASVAALLAREAATLQGLPPDSAHDLVSRTLASASFTSHARLHEFRTRDCTNSEEGPTAPRNSCNLAFGDVERGLREGHPFHPAPKSREPLGEAEIERYSPELGGSFPLHWFAAADDLVESDGPALTDVLPEVPTMPAGFTAVPAHPWQAGDLAHRPHIRALLRDGRLQPLGEFGDEWFPTSSLRTVYRPDSPVMLKLSLGLRITNSRRENLRKELYRGAEVARLLDAGLADAISARHPGFGIVRDPGWVAVGVDTGLDAVIRENPFQAGDPQAVCVAGLLESDELTGVDPEAWVDRYIAYVIEPVLWLYATYGLGLEAHQQNTLVALDSAGLPVGGRYRDNQGYYVSATRAEKLGEGFGVRSDSVVDDTVIDERLGYYIGVNNLLGVIGAFGARGLADEDRLLDVARRALRRIERSPLLDALLDSPTLRCKANLLTRVHEMDELVGPVSTQSKYVTIPNPLVAQR